MVTKRLFEAVAATTLLLWAPIIEASGEIKIFTNELPEAGEDSVEFHLSAARVRNRLPDQRAIPLRGLVEYAYGVTKHWGVALQLPVSQSDSRLRNDGVRLETQYVAPHDEGSGFYYGFRTEIARNRLRGEGDSTSAEFIPIVGYQVDRLHLTLNPGIAMPLTGGDSKRATFEPAMKIASHVNANHQVGIEYFADYGPLRTFLPSRERAQTLFAVWDRKFKKADLNVGIGRGLTDASERWVLKAIVEIALD